MVNVGNKTNHLIWQTLITKQITIYGKRWLQIKSPYMANVGNNTNHLIWQTLVTKQITLYGKRW